MFGALAFGSNLFVLGFVKQFPVLDYFRVASRAYLFVLIPVVIYFSLGLNEVAKKLSSNKRIKKIVVVLVMVFFIAENVSFPLMAYSYKEFVVPPASYINFFKKFQERSVVTDIPSDYRAKLPQSEALWTYSRDAIYMNWQSYHGQIVTAGINGYLPKSRLEMDEIIHDLPTDHSVERLISKGVNYLIFHKKMILFDSEDILESLRAQPKFFLEFEDESLAIFKVLSR